MVALSDTIRTTCPRDCYDSCGILVLRRDGAVHQVRGDPDHPISRGALCAKCSIGYNNEWLDPKARVTRPLRRSGPKGSGQFEPVSWDEALAAIAARLGEIADQGQAATILNAHYTGTIGLLAYLFPLRFFNRLGATEVNPDTICNMAGHVAMDYVYGTSGDGFDPRAARDAACILVWGANPSASAPHAHEHWLPEAPGVKIVVDPIRTETARIADLHLQPFPGSDAALAFAMLHVIHREGLSDSAFLQNHALGWEELEPLLEPCTPEWGESITGVPATLIEEAARVYGRGPSLLWLGQGLQRQPRGGNVMRACALLPAVSGNLGKPGSGVLYLNGSGSRHLDTSYLVASHLGASVPDPVSQMDLAEILADPTRSRALICWNINIAASSPQQRDLLRALRRDDLFSVVLDIFPTDTTDYADYVLPAATFLEFDDLVAPYFHLAMSAQVKAAEPPGEALPNQEIFRRLARAMGYSEPELFESDADMLATLLGQSGLGLDFAALAAVGTVPAPAQPLIQFAERRFPTPSGRVEIASARAEAAGHPRVPQPSFDVRPSDGRFRLLSPASAWTLNNSFANVAKVARRFGPPEVTLHPSDAAERNLSAGSMVVMFNESGRLQAQMRVSDEVPRGVALSYKGHWLKQVRDGANVNVLNPGQKSDMGESTSVHGVEVSIQAST